MSKRKFMPFGVMILLLVVALAAMGVGYGLWFEDLTIDGTVNTGEVDVGLSGPDFVEMVDVNGTLTLESDLPPEKDVADCVLVSTSDSGITGDDGVSGFTIEVTGAYPSYHCYVTFDVTNLGSVPVHVHQPLYTGPGWIAIDWGQCYADEFQLHTGESAYCTFLIHFTNADQVPENSGPIDFNFLIHAHQYNEEG